MFETPQNGSPPEEHDRAHPAEPDASAEQLATSHDDVAEPSGEEQDRAHPAEPDASAEQEDSLAREV